MKVAALFIYPIKSGPAVPVDAWQAEARGFHRDRRFVVTNAAGQFLTQRGHAALGRVVVQLTPTGLHLAAEGVGEVEVDAPESAATFDVQVWSDRVTAWTTTAAADEFYSTLLGEPARLAYMPPSCDRPTEDHPDVPLSFADAYPYLLASTSSLEALNARIPGEPVPMAAFRPSIVIDGAPAWAEDGWTELQIGEARFRGTTNCERCAITTLDPARPDRPRPDGEPLRTLAKFRRNARGKVDFARNAICSTGGIVRVGDGVTPTKK